VRRVIRAVPSWAWILVGVVAWTVANGAWWIAHRQGQSLNIDEAGYLASALNDAQSATRSGLPGWLRTVLWPSNFGPLVPAVASVITLAGVELTAAGAVVSLGFAAAALVGTWLLARRVVPERLAWLPVLITATAPGFVALSRMFGFGIPAAAVTTWALYALVRSRSHAAWRWSLVLGVLVGLMPMTRTMLVAFVPVVLGTGLVQALVASEGRGLRVLRWACSAAVSTVVAGVWLLDSWRPVFDYLVGFGYGAHSSAYRNDVGGPGASRPVLVLRSLLQEWYLSHTVLVLAGLLLGLVALAVGVRTARVNLTVRGLVASPAFVCLALVAGGVTVLMSSQNGGSGFTMGLLPAASILAVRGWLVLADVVRAASWVRVGALVATCATCLVIFLGWYLGSGPLAVPRNVDLGGLGWAHVTDGQQFYAGGNFPPDRSLVTSADLADEWTQATSDVAGSTLRADGSPRPTALGFRGVLLNVNTVALDLARRLGYPVAMSQVDPVTAGSDVEQYRAWLTDGTARDSCVLLTSPSHVNEYAPYVDTPALVAAARSLGFTPTREVPTPDGRTVTVWERGTPACAA